MDSNWTKDENKAFEKLVAHYPVPCPASYESIASKLWNKSVDQVRMHYEELFVDLCATEEGMIPIPNYSEDAVGQTMNENNNNNNNNYSSMRNNGESALVVKPEKKKRDPKSKWSEEEHRMFLRGLLILGKGDWRGISRKYVPTRSPTQVASHAQKYFLRQRQQGVKKRNSIHDITVEIIQIEQSSPNQLVAAVQQHGDEVEWQLQVQPQVTQVESYSQHVDDHAQQYWQDDNHGQSQEQHQQPYQQSGDQAEGQVQTQVTQVESYSQHLDDDALWSGLEPQYRQDDNHVQLQEQHQQPYVETYQQSGDLFDLVEQATNNAQWAMPQQQQQNDELESECMRVADHVQLQGGLLVYHDQSTPTMVNQTEQTSEVNESQGAQEGHQMTQQTSNKTNQLNVPMTLRDVIPLRSVQQWQMIQPNTDIDNQQISHTTSVEANRSQVEREEQNMQHNLNGDDQVRPLTDMEINIYQGLDATDDVLTYF